MSYKQREVTSGPGETWVAPSTRKLVWALSNLFRMRLPLTQGRSFPVVRRNGLLFMLIPNVETIWQSSFRKLSHPCCVTSIKTNETVVDRYSGKEINPYCWVVTKTSLKAAQRQEWSTVTNKDGSFCCLRAYSNWTRNDGVCKKSSNWKKCIYHRGLSRNF